MLNNVSKEMVNMSMICQIMNMVTKTLL